MFWGVLLSVLALSWSGALADSRFAFPEDIPNARIVSGWEAKEGEFPYQLSLRMVNPTGAVSACGASLIHNGWALTAAHCTARRVTLVIRAGTVNLTRPALIFETTEYYNHPLYIEELAGVVQPNDIGVIFLNRFIQYTDVMKPIRLQSSKDRDWNYHGQRLRAAGWGRTWTGGSSPENLNWVFLTGVSNFDCWMSFGGSPIVVDSTICARHYNVTSQSTCQGDSGGTLIAEDYDGAPTLVGVTSFVSSTGCHTGFPAGFIRPGYYHEWFFRVTGINFDWDRQDTTTSSPDETTTETDSTTISTTPEVPTTESTTTESPDTTTEAWETTTEADQTTTQATEPTTTTTEAWETTTEAEETTTEAEETTTEAEETTTEAEETTTEAVETTTEAEETTTEATEATTEPEVTTTESWETTTEEVLTTTEPESTTIAEETTTNATTEPETEESEESEESNETEESNESDSDSGSEDEDEDNRRHR